MNSPSSRDGFDIADFPDEFKVHRRCIRSSSRCKCEQSFNALPLRGKALTETSHIHPKPPQGPCPLQGFDTHPGLLRCPVQRYGGYTQNSPPKEETWMNFYTQQHK